VYRCDECGFEVDEAEAPSTPDAIVQGAERLAGVLTDTRRDVRARPAPPTWSPLEYSCHVRDVLLVQRERVLEARRIACPAPSPMGRDERAAHDGYAEQDPADVARQLRDAALLFANVVRRVDAAGEWERTMIYNYPVPTERPLRWVAVHTLHEIRHHLGDVTRT
jgi:hypothetical protein